jgi:hypothetical protein
MPRARNASWVQWKSVGVVKRKGRVAVEHGAFLQAFAFFIEDGEAALKRTAEARFLKLERFRDERLGTQQFGIGLAHFACECRHQPPHQRLFGAEQFGVAHGAPHDAAKHVAAALVRRQNAVGDQECRCT